MVYLLLTSLALASNLDVIGVPTLRAFDSTLIGTGIEVAQPEAPSSTNSPPDFEVSLSYVGRVAGSVTYTSALGSATNFPNAIGLESTHADSVGSWLYGMASGVSPGLFQVDNYDANYFYTNFVANLLQPSITAKVVNQSFIFGNLTTNEQRSVDTEFDNYAARHDVLLISAVGNGIDNGNYGFVNAPATCYNGIGVGVSDGNSSVGPTQDNGRCKPDITAPGGATSFSAPLVSGAAAILVQAGNRDDGGAGTAAAATDIRTVKTLLLNGAIKPTNWTHTPTQPLNYTYGAGVLNVFNSYHQLAAGKYSPIETTTPSAGALHPPGTSTNNVFSNRGWNFATISSTVSRDAVSHYYFNLTPVRSGGYTVTATLVWNRQINAATPAALDLFLYDASSNLVTSSISTVDNVEHIYMPQLAAGRYDLQVFKKGGVGSNGTETYALAFEIFAMPLSITDSGTNVVISWPVTPTGFVLQSAPILTGAIWTNVNASVSVIGDRNVVTIPASAAEAFYRLRQP